LKSKSRNLFNLFETFIQANKGIPATIMLSNKEKLNVILIDGSQRMPLLTVERNVSFPNFPSILLISNREIVAIGVET
jgi:hypothetical protein